ncbi:MAG: DegQ family serine endoprotease [Phyllobacterium sp.]
MVGGVVGMLRWACAAGLGLAFAVSPLATHAEESPNDALRGVLSDFLKGKNGSQNSPTTIDRQIPASRLEMQQSFSPLVKQTAPAVVNVYAARQVQSRSPFANDPFFEQFFSKRFSTPPRVQSSLGSGVIVDPTGIVVTNNHVIRNADEVKVALSDGREFESKVLLKDESSDIAILKIDGAEGFPFLQLADADKVEVGDLVLAIGNPFGVGQTVTSGIVSAQARTRVGISDLDFFIQTDAAINPGNSGGALVDMNGQLIGINTAIYSRSGGSIGIGFAIPSNMVKAVVDTARQGGAHFERPYIGATFQPVTPDVAESLGMTKPYGALIKALDGEGPASKAGLRVGDVVLSIDDVTVDNPDALGYRLSTAGIGKTVSLGLLSRAEEKTVQIVLVKPPENIPADERVIEGDNPLAGAKIVNLSPRNRGQLRLPADANGVAVTGIFRNSPASRLDLRPGDIIRRVNGRDIARTEDLLAAVSNRGFLWRFEFERGGTIIRQVVR